MGAKRVMPHVEEIVFSAAKYERQVVQAPHLTGFWLKFFVNILEIPLIGSTILYFVKKQNNLSELLRNTVIPDEPMFKPEFPPQDPESDVVVIKENLKPEERVELALQCLSSYDPSIWWSGDMTLPFRFRYWKIRDYAYAYRHRIVTPNVVAENIISAIEECSNCKHPSPFLISFDAYELREQAESSTKRFEEGKPLSVLDGIFVAIKDDIDCYPHPSKGATVWFHEVRTTKKDAACVSKLRQCGVILVGKANMHELGMGTTGNNPNFGTTRNPHCSDRYTGGSSSGPAAIVASGLCSAALGTDGGGSIRIPSSLCGVVGLKTTFERIDMTGSLCEGGTVAVIGPIASSVEDVMLVYAAILGSSLSSQISMKPPPPCFPNLSSHDHYNTIGSIHIGKYTEWFNDVYSRDISEKCEHILQLVAETHGCKILEITIPELQLMQTAHVVSIGSEALSSLSPYLSDGQGTKLTYDVRTNMALFQTFTATDFLAAQRLRRRLMYYHLEVFKTVEFIVTPTTGMTAPIIPPGAHESGETDLRVSGYLMRFILAGNLLGFPAISIPVGYDKEGLPIGMQLIGRPWSEASLLRLASAIEHICSSDEKKSPATFYQVLNPNAI